ncbi:preprotein translocase subunit YajC [Bacillota bacterium LX-D]|nr:preprotein translocase subunit YajC [Bacillota bacterium LX-D]
MQQYTTLIIYVVFIFGLFYFLMYKPQQKQKKARQELMQNLKVNAHVVTIGGLHGKIMKIKDRSVILRIADKVEVEFEKSAISYIAGKES